MSKHCRLSRSRAKPYRKLKKLWCGKEFREINTQVRNIATCYGELRRLMQNYENKPTNCELLRNKRAQLRKNAEKCEKARKIVRTGRLSCRTHISLLPQLAARLPQPPAAHRQLPAASLPRPPADRCHLSADRLPQPPADLHPPLAARRLLPTTRRPLSTAASCSLAACRSRQPLVASRQPPAARRRLTVTCSPQQPPPCSLLLHCLGAACCNAACCSRLLQPLAARYYAACRPPALRIVHQLPIVMLRAVHQLFAVAASLFLPAARRPQWLLAASDVMLPTSLKSADR